MGVEGRTFFFDSCIILCDLRKCRQIITERTHQIHAFLKGSDHAIRHLAFRDYLTAFPEVAKAYARIKKEGATLYSHSIDQYCEHKNDFVVKHEAEALAWFKNR